MRIGKSPQRRVFNAHFEQIPNPHRMAFLVLGGTSNMRDPILAGFLSLLIPGVGQLYNGRILAGILWLIFTPGFWIGTGGTLGWICHIIAAYTAWSYAKDHPVRV
jgi:TM2 domain-containing membrane protein YozV